MTLSLQASAPPPVALANCHGEPPGFVARRRIQNQNKTWSRVVYSAWLILSHTEWELEIPGCSSGCHSICFLGWIGLGPRMDKKQCQAVVILILLTLATCPVPGSGGSDADIGRWTYFSTLFCSGNEHRLPPPSSGSSRALVHCFASDPASRRVERVCKRYILKKKTEGREELELSYPR